MYLQRLEPKAILEKLFSLFPFAISQGSGSNSEHLLLRPAPQLFALSSIHTLQEIIEDFFDWVFILLS